MRPLFILFLWFSVVSTAQEYRLFSVGFYNVENFFDTLDDPKTFDDDYTPLGRKLWTSALVQQKAAQLATVILALKNNASQNLPVLLGLAEIENRNVLELLLKEEKLTPYNYAIVHFDSPDSRGIDVALLYQPVVFQLEFAKTYQLRLQSERKQYFRTTRDQLVVSGSLEGVPLTLLVNHWPSRRGGQKRSAPLRLAAARLQKRIIDSLQRLDPQPQIIAMGDFNDNPDNKSLLLLTEFQKSSKPPIEPLFNAMDLLYQKGIGSLAHNDQWFLFDQILLSQSFRTREQLFYVGAKIFNPPFLRTPEGRYKGYPYRTTQKGQRLMGYSDHFPVYVLLGIQTH